jgi:Na+-translocating ferredoxin:NAD+ oxidoreductase RnfC subunit
MQNICARCNAPCRIEQPREQLYSVLCEACRVLPAVREFVTREAQWAQQELGRADAARARFNARKLRLQREEQQRLTKLAERSRNLPNTNERLRAALQRARDRNGAPD